MLHVPGILYLSMYLYICTLYTFHPYSVCCSMYCVCILIPCFTPYICVAQWCCKTLYAVYHPCWVSVMISLLQPFGRWIPPTQLICPKVVPGETLCCCVLYLNLSSVCCEWIRKSHSIIVNVFEMACVLMGTLLFR